jgi:hypothetical protein
LNAPHFDVFISGSTGSVEDWQNAMNAPKSELPKLSGEQKEVARRMGIPEEEYARGVLVGQYGESRQKQRGETLGMRIAEVLDGVGSSYELEALIRKGVNDRWVARIRTPGEPRNVAIDLDLADDLIDSGTVQDLERLRVLMLQALGPQEMLGSVQ